jgi:hypothetical protein
MSTNFKLSFGYLVFGIFALTAAADESGLSSSGTPANAADANPMTLFFDSKDWRVIDPNAQRAGLAVHSPQEGSIEAARASVEEIMHLSGHFFDIANSGDGFDLFVVRQGNGDPAIVVWFYGYDVDGTRLWLISDLIIPGDGGDFSNEPMFVSSGSGFNGAGDFQQEQWGLLDFEAGSCGSATFTLTPTGQSSKVMNATQLIDIPGPGCLRPEPRAFQTIAGLSGNFFKMNEPGDGLNVHVANAGLVAFFYGYDSQGNPLWLLTSEPFRGPILPGVVLQFDLITGSGGNLYDVSGASLSTWGTLELTFLDCTSANARLIGNDGTKWISVVQLAQAAGSICEAPGTVELSQPIITFDVQGDKRTVEATVRNAQGQVVSSSRLEVTVQDEGVARVNSISSGEAEIEARTNSVAATSASFWDPVSNAVQDADINVVDFQPNAFTIPVQDVISGQTPLKGQTSEVVLTRNSLTESLSPGDYIYAEDLYGKIDSLQLEASAVRIQLEFASLIEVILNLNLSSANMASSGIQGNSGPAAGQVEAGSKGFSITKVERSIGSLECSINGDPISVGDFSADVVLNQPGGSVNRFYQIDNGVPSTDSNITGTMHVTGTVEIGLPSSPPLNSNVHCDIMSYHLQTPPLPLWPPYSGGVNFPVDIAVDFNLGDEAPDPMLAIDIGMRLQFDYNFASQALVMNVITGLAGDNFAEMDSRSLVNAPNGSQVTVTPSLDGPLGLYGDGARTGPEEMEFVHTTVGFPYDLDIEGPDDVFDPLFRGPDYQLSIDAHGQQHVDGASPLLDPLGFDTPDLPMTDVFGPAEAVLMGPPIIDMTTGSCGSNCGVGDQRDFRINLSRPGLFDLSLTGEILIYARSPSQTIFLLGAGVFTGQTPTDIFFSFLPTEAGAWEVLPRFESWDDGATYGGPSSVIDVTGEDTSCTLNVDVIGLGSVSSDPSGISCGNDCSHDYDLGQQVILSAFASEGWVLQSWSSNCDPFSESESCAVVMDCDETVTAQFTELQGQGGDPRVNLVWSNTDDLDLHCVDPCEQEIYFGFREASCQGFTGVLDVDANAGDLTTNPAENIVWSNGRPSGQYQCWVHNWESRNGSASYTLRINYGSQQEIHTGTLTDNQESPRHFFSTP